MSKMQFVCITRCSLLSWISHQFTSISRPLNCKEQTEDGCSEWMGSDILWCKTWCAQAAGEDLRGPALVLLPFVPLEGASASSRCDSSTATGSLALWCGSFLSPGHRARNGGLCFMGPRGASYERRCSRFGIALSQLVLSAGEGHRHSQVLEKS